MCPSSVFRKHTFQISKETAYLGEFLPIDGATQPGRWWELCRTSRTDHWLQDFKWRKNQDRISVGVDVFVFVGVVALCIWCIFGGNMGKFRVKVAPVLLLLRRNSMITLCMAETSRILPHLVALSFICVLYIYIYICLLLCCLNRQHM